MTRRMVDMVDCLSTNQLLLVDGFVKRTDRGMDVH